MLYHTADDSVEDRPDSITFSSLEGNVESQTQIKSKIPSERDKLLANTKAQRKENLKED